MIKIQCNSCGESINFSTMNYRCSKCGGIFDIAKFPRISLENIVSSEKGVMRYKAFLGFNSPQTAITLGEGGTPLVEDNLDGLQIFHKMESLNPTGSYKDRGSVVLINYLKERNILEVVEDSSGNAGASLAAYSARTGIKAKIFIPESASGPKRKQIEEYGAELITVPGQRSNAAKAVKQEAASGKVYASHAFMPMGMLGIATIAYELYEELGNEIQAVIIPVGHGGLMLGIVRGFEVLHESGYISQMPKFIGVQAKLCCPVANNFSGQTNLRNYQESIAEGVNVSEPVRGKAVVEFVSNNNGMIMAIEEDRIVAAYKELALRGIYVEPTSALTWAALKDIHFKSKGPVVLVQTGAGLKYQGL